MAGSAQTLRFLEWSYASPSQLVTGETLWDASAPIWVKGKHWGALRLGYRQAEGR